MARTKLNTRDDTKTLTTSWRNRHLENIYFCVYEHVWNVYFFNIVPVTYCYGTRFWWFLFFLETFEICFGEDTYECAYVDFITKRNVLFEIKMYTDIQIYFLLFFMVYIGYFYLRSRITPDMNFLNTHITCYYNINALIWRWNIVSLI